MHKRSTIQKMNPRNNIKIPIDCVLAFRNKDECILHTGLTEKNWRYYINFGRVKSFFLSHFDDSGEFMGYTKVYALYSKSKKEMIMDLGYNKVNNKANKKIKEKKKRVKKKYILS